MLLSNADKSKYPALDYYMRKNIPKLQEVPGVWRGLLNVAGDTAEPQIRLALALCYDVKPIVVVGNDDCRFFEPQETLVIRATTALRFEKKKPHMLRARGGKVYLAGLELLLGMLAYATNDGGDVEILYTIFLGQVYGLTYTDVRRAHVSS